MHSFASRLHTATALAVLAFAACAATADAHDPRPETARRHPKLLLAISVDQFSGDLFNEYRARFSAGLRTLQEGVVFPRAYQSHAATETCPGHSTLLTGARPARTGIVANNWRDATIERKDKVVYCAEDETVRYVDRDRELETDHEHHYRASAVHLRVPTLGERMKKADGRSRVIAVAGKDRAALMMGGAQVDEAWWWKKDSFVGLENAVPPHAVTATNDEIGKRLAEPAPEMPVPAWCASRNYPVALDGGRVVGTGRFAREAKARDAKASESFKRSPELDRATLELATRFVDDLALGSGPQTDLLIVGLSATDYVGHTYGTEGLEMCLQMDALDRGLGALLAHLDKRGIDYVVMLTADHGGHDVPERGRANAIADDARVHKSLSLDKLNEAIETTTGVRNALSRADPAASDVYLAPAIDGAQRAAVVRAALALWRAHPQVQEVHTREDILAAPAPSGPPETWSLLDEVRAGYDPTRSGDFVVLLKPRITPIEEPSAFYAATHGSPWDYDRRVPLLFWRHGSAGFEQPNSVETVDILPTLAAQIGLNVPAREIDGRCLDLDPGDGDTCAGP